MGQALTLGEQIYLLDAFKEQFADAAEIKEKIGVSVEKIPFYFALLGDASDNIPGVKGIGKKTAADLVNQFDSLEDLYDRLHEIKKAGVKTALLENKENAFFTLPPHDEDLLELLFNKLEENWQDSDFDIDNYCHEMAMSKSQLYRKTVALTGLSPNLLLKEFRLEKAKELMKKQHYNIAQITFDSGFTSPSYFTKCFKKKYGLLPMAYLDMLH